MPSDTKKKSVSKKRSQKKKPIPKPLKNSDNFQIPVDDQHMLNVLMNFMTDAIYFKDKDSRFIRINKYMAKNVNLESPDEAIGKSDFDFFTEEHARPAYEDEQKIISTGKPLIGFEERETWPDRPDTWVSTTKMPLYNREGEIVGTFGLSRDITEKKLAEEELKRYQKNLEAAHKETLNILQNVEEGLFILDSKFNISSQYSAALEKILMKKGLGNQNFYSLLSNRIPDKEIATTKRYLKLMFRNDVEEIMLTNLNPLEEILFNFENSELGWSVSKYLTFRFKRITDDRDKIKELIATVQDVTEEVKLSNKLKETEQRNQRQMDWIVSILHVEPQLLKEFLDGVEKELNFIEGLLRTEQSKKDSRELLQDIYRSVHLVKGNASLLDLKFFAKMAHTIEEKISELLNNKIIKGSDFIPIVMKVPEMKNMVSEIQELLDRIGRIHTHMRPKRKYESQLLIRSISNLIQNISENTGKKVNLDDKNFEGTRIPFQYRLLVKEMLIQFVRNAIVHGIETSNVRKKRKKPEAGTIKISTVMNKNNFEIQFSDDGQGVQLSKLRKIATQIGDNGSKKVATLSNEKLVDMIFKPGITTAETANLDAGRGMGLDLIKKRIEAAGGTIKVKSKENEYCSFIVDLPQNRKKK